MQDLFSFVILHCAKASKHRLTNSINHYRNSLCLDAIEFERHALRRTVMHFRIRSRAEPALRRLNTVVLFLYLLLLNHSRSHLLQ